MNHVPGVFNSHDISYISKCNLDLEDMARKTKLTHCNASRRHIMQGIKKVVPIGSNCFARSQKPIEFSFSRGGEVKKSAIPTIVITPMGKLM